MSDDAPAPGDIPSTPPHRDAPPDGDGGGSDKMSGMHESAKLQPSQDDSETIRAEAEGRKCFATIFSGVGLFTIVLSLILASCRIDRFVTMEIHDELHARLSEIGLVVHGVISVAAIYFAYEMLRAAERLLIPRRLYGDAKDAEVIQALTGVRAPSRFIARQVKTMLAEVAAVVKTASHVARAPRAPHDRDDANG